MSFLFPLLFIIHVYISIFINYLCKIFNHCKCLLFTDDLRLFAQIQPPNGHHKLQNDFDKFYLWSIKKWFADKCE